VTFEYSIGKFVDGNQKVLFRLPNDVTILVGSFHSFDQFTAALVRTRLSLHDFAFSWAKRN